MRRFIAEFGASWNLIIEYRVMVVIWMSDHRVYLSSCSPHGYRLLKKGPVGSYDRHDVYFVYYLAALVVRNMTGMWFIWEMDSEMRLGSLSFRLLKPMDPIVHYFAYACSSKPFRVFILGPASVVALLVFPGLNWSVDPLSLLLFVTSLGGRPADPVSHAVHHRADGILDHAIA
jgi:ABC-2 type transport system permease protein